MEREFTQEQIKGLIRVKNALIEEGFDIHYPLWESHPEEIIAVSKEKWIVVDISAGRNGTIFLNYHEQEQPELKKLLEEKTGVTLRHTLLTGAKHWRDEIEKKYSGEE